MTSTNIHHPQEHSRSLGDYLDAFRRMRGKMLVISLVIAVIGITVALLWPPTFKSVATILIEEQEIPSDLVRSTVTSFASQRIQTISQRVMTRSNLMDIVKRYDLYPDDRKRKTTEEIINRLREDISVDMINAQVVDPRTGRPTVAAIAFSVSFSYDNPTLAQKVASELTSLYLSENLKNRTAKAAETYEFLTDEADRWKTQIADVEQKLAKFKEENSSRLPELRDVNTRLLDRTEIEIGDATTQIRSLEDRRVFLEGQLEIMDPYGSEDEGDITNPATRLKAARTQHLSMVSRYSPDHPDVLKLKREIEGLEQEVGGVSSQQSQRDELRALRSELASTREQYSDEHPDIVRLNKTIGALESELQNSTQTTPAPKRSPDNPAYVRLQAELRSTNRQIGDLTSKRADLEKKLDEVQQRLFETPQVESAYRKLARDLRNANNKYQEITAKQMQADIGQQLEAERKGERFTLIEPAALPEEPVSPNRPAIMLLSLFLGIGGGIGFGVIAESIDSSVRGPKAVQALLGMAPLAVIPYRETRDEGRNRSKRKWVYASAAVGSITVALLVAHFFWTPLDVLWFKALRKASIVAGNY